MATFNLDINVIAICEHCPWSRRFNGPNPTIEATAAGVLHTLQEHPDGPDTQ